MDELLHLFEDLDEWAERAAAVHFPRFQSQIRYEFVSESREGYGSGSFAALPISCYGSLGAAFPYLFMYDLFSVNEWKLVNPPADMEASEWVRILRIGWIPDYLGYTEGERKAMAQGTPRIPYRVVTEEELRSDVVYPYSIEVLNHALQSPVRRVIRYGTIDAWNNKEYTIETETEHILFSCGTSV